MALLSATEPNDSFGQANTINLGDTMIGSLGSSTDRDFFKVTTTASGVLQFDVGTVQLANWAFAIQVYDASQKLLGAAYLGYVTGSTFSIGALNPGTYYIGVSSSNIYSGQTYSITPTFIAADAHDYETESNDTIATANAVALNHVIYGQTRSSSDVDSFKVDVGSSGFLALDFKSPATHDYADYVVSVFDPQGKVVDMQTTGGHLSMVERVAVPGTYTVQVKAAAGGSYQSANYSFVAHADAGTAPPANATLTTTAPASGALSSVGQADWYRVNLQAGQLYEFALAGAQTGGGTLADGSLVLVDASGHTVESAARLPTYSSGGTAQTADPQLAFTAAYTGTYYLRVGGYGSTGSYTLSEKTDTLAGLLPALTGEPSQHWGPVGTSGQPLTITYSFLTATASGETGFKAMSETQKQSVRAVLAQYSSFLNVDFKEISDPSLAQICYGTSDQHNKSGGIEYDSTNADGTLRHANVFVNNTAGSNGAPAESTTMAPGQYGYEVLIHETGHALGLKHPGDYDSINGSGVAPYIAAAWDNRKFTAMSYVDNLETSGSTQTPSLLDVAALQGLYGARTSPAAQTVSFAAGVEIIATVVSGSASATLDLSNQTTACTISLTPGTFSSVGMRADGTLAHDNLALAFGTRIASLLAGSGNDYIIAADGGCTIDGGGGSDTLFLSGTRASFTVAHGSTGYTVIDHGGNLGTDTLVNVERLDFSGSSLLLASDASIGQTLTAGAGGGQANGTSGDDIYSGGGADDTYFSNGGNDVVDGGAGLDTVVLSGTREAYAIKVDGACVTANSASAGVLDTLSNVERVRFADDRAVAFDIDGHGGQAYRLYQAAFNRKPDLAGLGFWMQFMDKGMSLVEVATRFEQSAEFMGLYGAAPSDTQLVTLYYNNVLHRTPQQFETNFWVGILESTGTNHQSAAQVLVSFSESPENQAQVIGAIQGGFDYVYFA